MRQIRFTANALPYGPGETAGFADDIAEAYVSLGVAEYVTPEGEPDPAAPAALLEPVDSKTADPTLVARQVTGSGPSGGGVP